MGNFPRRKCVYELPDKGGAGLEDKELIARCQQGDMDAFEQLLARYEKKVYTIAYKYMNNPEDASDMAQEALMKAYQSITRFRGESSFGTWIGRITSNQCLDELRKRKKLQVTSLDAEVELENGSVQKEIADTGDTPEEYAIRQETAGDMQTMIGQLREEYRVVLILRELEGHSYEEIAQLLSCSLGTVKSRISRARSYLKEQIMVKRKREGRE